MAQCAALIAPYEPRHTDPGCTSLARAAWGDAVAVVLDLDLRDIEAAEHRRPSRPERRPCPGEASLGAVPPWTRRTGDRCGEAG
ncbi:hypothetical protein FKV25_03065, partial [Lysobacter aestuarii]